MSSAGLTITVTPQFMDRVAAVEQYLGRDVAARGREFVATLFDFLYDTVLAFPAYSLPRYPELALRRAVFRRHYSVVYEVTAQEIKYLAFFANAQDVSQLDV